MALVLANRVQETTTTTGTGTITLAGAVSGYQSFAAIGNGNTTYYTITSGTAWEVGIGTYSTTGPTLARTTILSSSAGGAAITLAGTSTVFSTYPANRSVNYDEANSLTLSGTAISAPAWTTTGIGIKQVATTYTDTTSTGTVPNVYINNFAAQTLAATNTITVSQLYGTFFTTPTAGTNVTATERWSIGTDTLRVTGGILMDGTAGNFIQLATAMTSGQFILGNTAGTGNVTLGRSTVSQTTNIQAGATASGSTKTLNIGTAGLSGSTTNITIGSAVSGATSTTTLNGTVSVASVIAASLGSAAAPSYTFTGDTNTGMFSPGADTIAFSEGGVEAMRINSSGNVGIGETSPGARLQVSGGTVGTTAGNLLNVTIDQGIAGSNGVGIRTNLVRVSNGTDWTTTAMRLQGRVDVTNFGYIDLVSGGAQGMAFGSDASERMRIDSSGNVGIGTSAPPQLLAVGNSTDQVGAGISAAVSTLYFGSPSTGSGGIKRIAYDRATGSLNFIGNTVASPSTQMTLDSSGNLGIGTSSPTTIFHVQQNNAANIGMRMRQLSTTQFAGAGLLCNGPVSSSTQGGTAFYHYNRNTGGTNGALAMAQFDENGSFQRSLAEYYYNEQAWLFYTNGSERLRIDSSGNVMVGTTSATGLFSVNGVSYGSMIATNRFGVLGNNLYFGTGNFRYIGDGHAYGWSQGNTDGADLRLLYAGNNTSGAGAVATTSERIYITAAGNVGIGTSSPSAKLDVNGNASFGATITTGTGVSTGDAHLELGGNRSGSGTVYMDLHAVAGGDFNSRIIRYGGTNGGMDIINLGTGGMVLSQEGAAPMVFKTTATERMRIDSSGNVGIGTSGPGYRLDIASGDTTAGLGYAMRIRSNATATAATLQFTNSAVTTQNGIIACSDTGAMTIQTDGASSVLAFRTNGNERFRILSTGGITSSDLADAVGYKGVPQNSQTASYTLALSDMGKHISITTGGVVIPANGSVAFPIGSTITIYNNSASAQNISITTDTLRLAGTATSGTRSLAQRGLATCIKVAATEWVVTGNVT